MVRATHVRSYQKIKSLKPFWATRKTTWANEYSIAPACGVTANRQPTVLRFEHRWQCLLSCGLGMQWNHFWSLQRYGLRRMAASQQVYDKKAKSFSPKRCSELAVTMRHWAGNVCSFPYFIGKYYTYHRSDCYWITLTYFNYLTILTRTACISCSYRWKCRSRWIPGHSPRALLSFQRSIVYILESL
jgi:hypothetical protein